MTGMKPCPFCGHDGDIVEWNELDEEHPVTTLWVLRKHRKDRKWFTATCVWCNCVFDQGYETKEAAVEDWNKRQQ